MYLSTEQNERLLSQAGELSAPGSRRPGRTGYSGGTSGSPPGAQDPRARNFGLGRLGQMVDVSPVLLTISCKCRCWLKSVGLRINTARWGDRRRWIDIRGLR